MEEHEITGSKTGHFDVSNLYDKHTPRKSSSDHKPAVTAIKYRQSEDDDAGDNNNQAQLRTGGDVEKCTDKLPCTVDIQVYKKRYLMLFLFALCSMMNGFPQFQYTVVADIVACYYGVGVSDINWTCVVYMVLFLPFVFPVMYLMEKKGLRITLIIGAVLNCIGSWVQCCSFAPDRFIVIMACQTIYALGQVFVLSLPPFIAGVWFGAGEVGLACALGVFGNQLGIAIGFIVPPSLMTNDCSNQADIAYEMSLIAYPMAIINTLILLTVILVYQAKPDSFPSIAQAAKEGNVTEYGKSLKRLFSDIPFVLLLLGYGLITGTYFAMSTIMNEMVLFHFPGEDADAGWLGAIMVFAGMLGSVILGTALDRTRKYKQISLLIFVLSFLLMTGYTVLIQVVEKIWIQFLFFTLLGLIMTGYLPAGFDFGAEITYPEPEAMSASLLNTSIQVFSIILTNIASPLLLVYGDQSSNIFLCACLFIGIIVMACIKCELRRNQADSGASIIKQP